MRTRKQGKSIGDYVAQLRKLSEHCNFGDTLDSMLRDRLVCGCNDHRLQCKLLAEPDLTFTKAFNIAKAVEMAECESREMQNPAARSQQSVHAVTNKTNSQARQRKQLSQADSPHPNCYHCSGRHSPAECKYRDSECHFCRKKGHLGKVCKTKLRAQRH